MSYHVLHHVNYTILHLNLCTDTWFLACLEVASLAEGSWNSVQMGTNCIPSAMAKKSPLIGSSKHWFQEVPISVEDSTGHSACGDPRFVP